MSKNINEKKSEFSFKSVNMIATETVIKNWLFANNFKRIEKTDTNYYFNYDSLKGKRSFEYIINGDFVTIYAYIGTFEKPTMSLEGFYGIAAKAAFKKDLEVLFEVIENHYMPKYANEPVEDITKGNIEENLENDFVKSNIKVKNTLVIAGFIVSLVGVILGFTKILLFGFPVIAFEILVGIYGLKTKLKGLAIATIVLAVLSFISFFFLYV